MAATDQGGDILQHLLDQRALAVQIHQRRGLVDGDPALHLGLGYGHVRDAGQGGEDGGAGDTLMKRTLHILLPVALAMALAPSAAWAQIFNADTPLLALPDAAAKLAGQARAGAAVRILKRQGFWLEVEAGGVNGWVKLSAVKLATPAGPAVLDTGRLGSGNIVATSAARGLSAKDLLEGRSDEKAVDRLAEWRPESRQLQLFASEGGLAEVRLAAFLQAPRAETTSAAPREIVESGGSAGGSRPRRNRKGADEDM